MPESVRDRCTKAHEYIFMLTKSARYYFDRLEMQEDAVSNASGAAASFKREGSKRGQAIPGQKYGTHRPDRDDIAYNETRNRRSVWHVPTRPYREAHFATFPPKLIEPCVLATCPEKVCAKCGAPHYPIIKRPQLPKVADSELDRFGNGQAGVHRKVGQAYQDWRAKNPDRVTGHKPTCTCDAGTIGGVLLDPFAGSGTALAVAVKWDCRAIGIELNPDYIKLIEGRMHDIVSRW